MKIEIPLRKKTKQELIDENVQLRLELEHTQKECERAVKQYVQECERSESLRSEFAKTFDKLHIPYGENPFVNDDKGMYKEQD